MIKKCKRCGKERRIYAKELCASCWVYTHQDKKKLLKRSKEWAKENRKWYRDYQRKKAKQKKNKKE